MSTTLDLTQKTLTPDDLLNLPNGKDYELVDGILAKRGMGAQSSWIAARMMGLLQAFCRSGTRAWLFDAECGYLGLGRANTVRKPDVSVVLGDRLPEIPSGWIDLAPDLAAEVVSPNDTVYELERKIREYLEGGVRLVWVILPETREIRVLRPDGTETRLREADTLNGEEVLPGFSCPVAELFPPDTSAKESAS